MDLLQHLDELGVRLPADNRRREEPTQASRQPVPETKMRGVS
jgi:hypothetical protein